MIAEIAVAVPLFAATNVDDIFVLIGFFSDRRFKTAEILIGQFAGIALLIAFSVLVALLAMAIPTQYIGLLGFAPLIIGLKKLYDLLRGKKEDNEDQIHDVRGFGIGNIISVATVTIANGGDNVGVYAPLFAVRSALENATIVTVFLAMTLVWCLLAFWMVNHPALGAVIRRQGSRLLPIVLIVVGIMIISEAHVFDYFISPYV